MYHLNAYELNDCQVNLGSNPGGQGPWVPARPMCQPFICRFWKAWDVLTGKAESIIFPGQDGL